MEQLDSIKCKYDDEIVFLKDKTIGAKNVGEREVEHGEQGWFLSLLVRKIFEDKNQLMIAARIKAQLTFVLTARS